MNAMAINDMGDGVSIIAAERQRQVEVEGYRFAHDDQHDEGELAITHRSTSSTDPSTT